MYRGGGWDLATATVTNVLGNVLYDQDAADILYEALKGCRERWRGGALTKIDRRILRRYSKRGLLRRLRHPPRARRKRAQADELIVDDLADDLEDQRKIYGAMHENTPYAAAALADFPLAYGLRMHPTRVRRLVRCSLRGVPLEAHRLVMRSARARPVPADV